MKPDKWVACYCRVSTADQEKGLKSQIHALKSYCRHHGLKPVRWYRDVLSGDTTKRPAFDKLQRRIFQGRVHTVIVWKLDRVTRRGMKDGITILTDWLDKGVRIVSVTEQFDFTGQIGQIIAGLMFALAAMDRERIRENTKRGLATAKANGVKLGRPVKVTARRIVPLLEQGLKRTEIARRLGVTRQGLHGALLRMGIIEPKGGNGDAQE